MKPLRERIAFGRRRLGLTEAEAALLAKLKTPEKIQDFINDIPINKEPEGDTCLSAREVLKQNRAHCIEGAFVAAAAMWLAGHAPLLMDMKAEGDDDHVIVPFHHRGYWGAMSKSNHVFLRWRDPVYASMRELMMSYFHEYVSDAGHKTLRSYSVPFDLRRHNPALWVTSQDSCWDIAWYLDQSRHYDLVTSAQVRRLRGHDKMEMKAGKILEYP